MTALIELLPAPVRHTLAAFIGVFLTTVIAAIISAEGVTGVLWNETLISALNKGVVGAVGVFAVLFVTPLTDAYGVGKVTPLPEEVLAEPHVDDEPLPAEVIPEAVPAGDPDGVEAKPALQVEADEAGGEELVDVQGEDV
jgi:hypothetical protein